MQYTGRRLSWKAGRSDAKILVMTLQSLANGELAEVRGCTYLETTIRVHWEGSNLWVTKTTLRTLAELTEKCGQRIKPEQIRNALLCLKALGILEDKRGVTNSRTITGSDNWRFMLKLLNENKWENLDWLFGRGDQEGKWEQRRTEKSEPKKSELPKEPLPKFEFIPPCPYRALEAFREEHAEFFFGREAFTEQLVKAVRDKPLVAVLGRSGSGKSSVVFAGLIPRLKQDGHWLIASFSPKTRPFYKLAEALIPLLEPQMSKTEQIVEAKKLAKKLRQENLTLQDVMEGILQENPTASRLLLVVDQFEEVYTLCPEEEERRRFLDELLAAVHLASQKHSPDFIVVLTLRDDFLGHALDSSLGKALQEFKPELLCSMTRQELQDALEKPAEKLEVKIEECLTERILDAVVGEPGILPCLEFALTQLWKKQKNRVLNHSAYKEIGGVEKALANYADEVFDTLNEQDQQIVQRIFIQLVNFEEKTQDTRRLATRTQVGKDNWDLVRRLADARLVVTGRDEATKEETVEVVHEALIRGWQRLRDWIEDNHKFRTWQERLRAAVARWEVINYDEGALLQKALLVEAEDWIEKRGNEITTKEKAFIKASREYEDRGRKIQEELRRQAEISESHALVSLSQARLLLHNQLGALVAAVKAGRKLQEMEAPSGESKRRTIDVLRQVIYSIREHNCLQGHSAPVKSVSFSPDGQTIASCSADKTVRLWQLDGTLLQIFQGHSARIWNVSFSPNGQKIASASDDHTMKLWHINGTLLQTFQGHSDTVKSMSFSPNGQTIASGSFDHTMKLWHINGTLLHTFQGHSDTVKSVSFSPDGQTIASASDDKTVKLWRLDGTLLQTFQAHNERVYDVSFSPDGQTITSASADKTVRLWQLDGTLLQTFQGHSDRVNSVSFSTDGQMIVSASGDHTVKLWRLDGTLLQTFQAHSDYVNSVSFSPDGQTIASASGDHTVRLWHFDSTQTFQGHRGLVNSVSFSPDGQTITSASDDHTMKLWQLDGTPLQTFQGHSDWVRSVSFSPDGQTIASGSADHTVRLWQLDGTPLQTFQGHSDWVRSVSFSPDGQTIASGSADHTVKLWQLDGKLLQTFRGHNDWVNSVSFSPDSQMIVSASGDHTVKLWRLDGTLLQTLQGHNDRVNNAGFSVDGQTILSASGDHTARLWRLDGTLVKIFEGHNARVNSVSFSPDSQTFASASGDTVRLWSLDSTEGISELDVLLANLLVRGCNWVRDYLKTNPNVSECDRYLCDAIEHQGTEFL